MANKKFVVKLSSEERKRPSELISKGKSAAKIVLKARILLKADQSEEGEGWTDERIRMTSIELFLTKHLKLMVNKAKSAVAAPQVRKFLSFSFTSGTNIKRLLAPQTVARFKARVQELMRRPRGRSLAQIVKELSVYLIGWRGYFGFWETPTMLRAPEPPKATM